MALLLFKVSTLKGIVRSTKGAKLHSLDEIKELVELHKYGLVDFDEQLVRRLVEKITIFQRYMEFTFKDGEVIRVNM